MLTKAWRHWAAAALAAAAAPAAATLTVTPSLTARNMCGVDVAIAVHYKATSGWTTTPFIVVPARGTKHLASSNNRIFYYYAESLSRGLKWDGEHGFKVDGKVYGVRKTTLNKDEDRNRFLLSISC